MKFRRSKEGGSGARFRRRRHVVDPRQENPTHHPDSPRSRARARPAVGAPKRAHRSPPAIGPTVIRDAVTRYARPLAQPLCVSLHLGRSRPIPSARPRNTTSRSITTPTICPRSSTTGSDSLSSRRMTSAASTKLVAGAHAIADCSIKSRTCMAAPSQHRHRPNPGSALDPTKHRRATRVERRRSRSADRSPAPSPTS